MSLLDNHGWTPIVESIAKGHGLVSAAVFGIVWRHCQMADGICRASMETMAEALGTDRATVLRHIKKLCKDGYLEDLTPDRRNAPHTYADTGKADLEGEINEKAEEIAKRAAKNHHTNLRRAEFQQNRGRLTLALIERDGYKCAECGVYEDLTIDHVIPVSKGGSDDLDNLRFLCRSHNSKKGDGQTVAHDNNQTVAYNNSYKQSVAENNATVAQRNATVAESYLKIDSEETLKNTTSKEVGASPPKPIQKGQRSQTIPAIVVFVEVTGKYVLNNTQIKAIDERVGRDPPALQRWRETVTAWQLRGYKINNVDGMLEWFKKGIPEYKNGATNGHHQTQTTNQARPLAQGHSAPAGTNEDQQSGGLVGTSRQLSDAFKSKSRGGRDPT